MKSIVELWENSQCPPLHVLESPEERREWGLQKNVGRHNFWKFSKFYEIHELTDPRSSMNPKHKKHQVKYIKVHHNQMLKTGNREKSYRGTNMDGSRFYIRSSIRDSIICTPYWSNTFNVLQENTVNLEFCTQQKYLPPTPKTQKNQRWNNDIFRNTNAVKIHHQHTHIMRNTLKSLSGRRKCCCIEI